MPHVSRHAPTRRVSDKTRDLFMDCVTAKWSPEERRAFFHDLLTPTERIMLSKRLAIIYMLVKGYTFNDIQEELRISPSTVSRIWKAIETGKYKEIARRIQASPKEDFDFLRWFVDLMPPLHQTKREYANRARRLKL